MDGLEVTCMVSGCQRPFDEWHELDVGVEVPARVVEVQLVLVASVGRAALRVEEVRALERGNAGKGDGSRCYRQGT